MSAITAGSSIQEETLVIDERNVASEVEFIGLEFTESYYYKPEEKWYAVAYIVREDAWIQYRPKIESEKTSFHAFLKKAESEDDSFTKIWLYKSAWKVSGDFLERLEYGRIINPKEEDKYSEDRTSIAELPAKIEAGQKNLTVRVHITGDYGNIIETAVETALSDSCFIVGPDGNYTADVVVSSNTSGSNPLTIMPFVSVSVRSISGKSIYSFESKLTEKNCRLFIGKCSEKAFPKLAENINREMNF